MTPRELSALDTPQGEPADETHAADPCVPRHTKNPDVVWVEARQDRCSVADISDFRQFELTGPSAEVWSRLDGVASDDEVVRAVLTAYPDHPDSAYSDCVSFIETMTSLGLLDPRPTSPAVNPATTNTLAGGRSAKPAQKGTLE